MIEGLSIFCISGCIGLEIYCGVRLRKILKARSDERTDARREALRPPAYKKVRDSWTVYRNRRRLWESIQK